MRGKDLPQRGDDWFGADFNPILLTTAQGMNLLHIVSMSAFIRDGHGVGILSNWDNPMRMVGAAWHNFVPPPEFQQCVVVRMMMGLLRLRREVALQHNLDSRMLLGAARKGH